MSQREYVDSSDLAWVEYDQDTLILRIDFHNDEEYEYVDVPRDTHENLMIALSKGRFLHQYIAGHFQYRRIR